ncbi:MAG: type II toxin-antitoxin system VapC family toxin [Verrucomicrobiales bacterium]
MDRILLDTNVVLDVLAARVPFLDDSRSVWELCEGGVVDGWISAITFNNVFYVLRKFSNLTSARRHLRDLRRVFQVAPVNAGLIDSALASSQSDFEDALQYGNAISIKAKFLITRNTRDFPKTGPVSILSPRAYLKARSV